MASNRMETTYVPDEEEKIRKVQEGRVVQEGTDMWWRRKEELLRQKHREQRELRLMQTNYSPWGKPGGGAPYVASMRKKNVILEPLDVSRNCSYSDKLAQPTNPWGRPGPGGIPWRDPKLFGVRFLESMGWTSGTLIGRLRGGKEEIDPLAAHDPNKFFNDNSRPGLPFDTYREMANRDIDRVINRESRNNRKNDCREEIQMYKLTGGVELVPLLINDKYHGYQHQGTRYIATDATRPGFSIDSLRALKIGNREHVVALSEQIRRKQERVLEERKMEQETCRRHFETWRRLWGRPGNGAPLDHNRRNDLYDILYKTAIF